MGQVEGDVVKEQGAEDEERSLRANELVNKACEEHGVKVCSWDEFVAWNKYVDGAIGEAQLDEEAKREIKQLAKSFGKYVVLKKDEPKHPTEEEQRRERARLANKIYKRVCEEAGVNACFFQNFSAWSDYVNNKIDESEFYAKAVEEIKQAKTMDN